MMINIPDMINAIVELSRSLETSLELEQLKTNNPNLYDSCLDKHKEIIAYCKREVENKT
mgnify:CR=1 FL=1